MKHSDTRGGSAPLSDPLAPDYTPAGCPACASVAIVTTAKTPDANSYWRCTGCGEIWNASRRQTAQTWRRQWR